MSSLIRRTGIILQRRNVGAVDRRVTLLADDGKHDGRARGTQKLESKLAGSLEPLTLVELTMAPGRGAPVVTGSLVLNSYRRLRSNLARLAGAGLVAAAADALVRGPIADPRPLRAVRGSFGLLGVARTNREVFVGTAYGLIRLVAGLGESTELSFAHPPPVLRLRQVMLANGPLKIRRVRCTVSTARRTVLETLDLVERIAERPLSAGTFFRHATGLV